MLVQFKFRTRLESFCSRNSGNGLLSDRKCSGKLGIRLGDGCLELLVGFNLYIRPLFFRGVREGEVVDV
jgi:hypothetical protein